MTTETKNKLVQQLNIALAKLGYWESEAEDLIRYNRKRQDRIDRLRKILQDISTVALTDNINLVRKMAKKALKSDQIIASKKAR